jgi:hypothetical protein
MESINSFQSKKLAGLPRTSFDRDPQFSSRTSEPFNLFQDVQVIDENNSNATSLAMSPTQLNSITGSILNRRSKSNLVKQPISQNQAAILLYKKLHNHNTNADSIAESIRETQAAYMDLVNQRSRSSDVIQRFASQK